MASAHYNLALQEWWKATIGDITAAGTTVNARILSSANYVFSQSHQWLTSLPAGPVADVTLGVKTANGAGADPGCFNAANITFPAVPAGAALNCLVVYKSTGTPGTSNLLFYIDGFSVTPNGGDITVQWQQSVPWIAKL
jgi:hypothetical protein